MMETLSIATSATVLPALLACVIAFYVFFHCLTTEKKGQNSSKIPMQSVRGKLQRKLDKVEKAMVGMGKFGPGSGIDVNVLLVESSCSLEQEMVVKALGLLARKYPLLRMRLVEGDDDLSHFIELDDFVTPSFRRGQSSSTDWERCFAEDSKIPFDYSRGPLWRVTQLQEVQSESGNFKNALLFTFHHCICDGGSIMALYSQFLDYLNLLYKHETIQVQSMELRPPMTSLLQHKTKTSSFEKIFFSILPMMIKIKSFVTKPANNSFLEVFPLAKPEVSIAEKKTCVLPKEVNIDEMARIAKLAKEYKSTVHGVVTAATHIALAQILNSGAREKSAKVNIKSSFNVSMRKECLPEVKPDEFGCFISIIQQQTNVQTKQEYTKEEFWKRAAEFTSKVHGMMKQQKHFEFVKFLNNVNFKSFQNSLGEGGRFDNIFNISNRGRYVFGTEDTGPFKFNGTYFAMAEQHCGPVFTNNLVSVNGKLFLGLVYYPHILTEEHASQFINLTLCILRKAIA